jgi:hypothetical protein
MFYAVRVVQAIGRDPHGLIDTDALLRFGQQAEPGTWADADVALWGDTLYMLGADLSEGLAEKIRAAARRCAELLVTPPVARQVGLCRDALLHFGGVPGPLRYAGTDWSSQPAAILLDVTSSTGSPPDKRAVERAVRDLAEVPESLATTELAALPSVARLVDAPLSKEEEHALTAELRHRHGREPLSALFTVRADGSFPDFASTSAVARMYVATR